MLGRPTARRDEGASVSLARHDAGGNGGAAAGAGGIGRRPPSSRRRHAHAGRPGSRGGPRRHGVVHLQRGWQRAGRHRGGGRGLHEADRRPPRTAAAAQRASCATATSASWRRHSTSCHPTPLGRRTIALPTVTTAQERVQGGNALLPDAGMYPVTIELRSDNVPLAQLTSAIVRLGRRRPAGRPSTSPSSLPIDGAPTLQADGTTIIDDADRMRLQTLTTVLAGNATAAHRRAAARADRRSGPHGPARPMPHVRAALAAAIGNRQVLAQPYVSMDPTAMGRAGLAERAHQAAHRGRGRRRPGTARRDHRSHDVGHGQQRSSAEGMPMLRDLGVRRVVVPAEALDPAPDAADAPTTAVEVGAGGDALPVRGGRRRPRPRRRVRSSRPDPVLGAPTSSSPSCWPSPSIIRPPPVARASWWCRPATGNPTPPSWRRCWRCSARTRCCTPSTLDAVVPRRGVGTRRPLPRWPPPTRPISPTSPPASPSPASASPALTSMLPSADPLPAVARRPAARSSIDDSFDATQRQAYLDAVNGELNVLADAVDPIPTRRITLASRSTEVPITLHRRIDRPIQVRVHLESPKLSFPAQRHPGDARRRDGAAARRGARRAPTAPSRSPSRS